MFRVLATSAVALMAATADAAGVCYSPFYSPDYAFGRVADLLARDFQDIASQGFTAVRTYHSQFFGENVVNAAKKAGIKVAIGIQMQGSNGGEYPYLQADIDAAVWAAQNAPENVLAIYAGNENLRNGNFGSVSGDRLVQIINGIKSRLRGTRGENVPVGTVQRLEEWLSAPDAGKVAAACDVTGANIYPFFTPGAQNSMKAALSAQWNIFASRYGGKARLTETGWATQGGPQVGNMPSTQNAENYFNAFTEWTRETPTDTPFYFMMYDVPSAGGDEVERHFGIASSSKQLKFKLSNGGGNQQQQQQVVRSFDFTPPATVGPAPTQAPQTPAPTTPAPTTPAPTTPAPTTPAPTTPAPTTPEPTTEAPTTAPTTPKQHEEGSGSYASASAGSYAGSYAGAPPSTPDDIVFPSKNSTAGSQPEAGVVPETDEKTPSAADTVPTPAFKPAAPAAPVAPATPSAKQSAADEAGARAANSRVALDTSGNGSVTTFMFAGVGFLGVAAIVVVAVYMRRQNEVEESESETRTVAASSVGAASSSSGSEPRGSTPSVYDDPLNTRFSSIVMMTPNGDGVCIL